MGKVYYFIDESGFDDKPGHVLVACVRVDDPYRVRTTVEKLKQDIIHDPVLSKLPSVSQSLATKGFHFAEDDIITVKQRLVDMLPQLDFRTYAYIANKADILPNKSSLIVDFQTWWSKLAVPLLADRILKDREEEITFIFEQTSGIKTRDLRQSRAIVSQSLEAARNKLPALNVTVNVDTGTKEDGGIAVADYACGIIKSYRDNINVRNSWQQRFYLKLEPKIGLIADLPNNKYMTRLKGR